jgi:hypothetical protein
VGRFLSEDVLRFQTGTGFYSYALNRPTSISDPSGMFPTWWHRNMTYQEASKVFGPKCQKKANDVADADAAIDALPTFRSKVDFMLGRGEGWKYGGPHFPVSDTDSLIPLENAVKTCDLGALGHALHTLQDSYAHWPGPFSPTIHYFTFSAMDYGALLNGDSREGATLNTEAWLWEFKNACLKCCQ